MAGLELSLKAKGLTRRRDARYYDLRVNVIICYARIQTLDVSC